MLLALFLLGSFALYKSKFERQLGVFFIIRSSYGIKLIDLLARIKPAFWKFIADFSVYLSFGGIGAYYLSKSESRKALYYGQILFASLLFIIVSRGYGLPSGILLVLSFTAFAAFFHSRKDKTLDAFFSAITLAVLTNTLLPNTLITIATALFGMPALLIFGLVSHSLDILSGASNLPGVSPLMPTTQGGEVGVSFPGFDIFIPWWHALIAIIVTLVSHEAAHGILTRVAGVKLKSTGILSLGALPIGAFVEPDEDELKRKSSIERMRVFTMGSFANLAVGVLSIILFLLLSNSAPLLLQEHGIAVISLTRGYPAEKILEQGDVIYSINNVSTDSILLFQNATSQFKAGETVELNTSKGILQMTLASAAGNASKGQMGVLVSKIRFMTAAYSVDFLLEALGWIIFFSMNIALVNLLPVLPFDGGRMFKEIIDSLSLSEISVKRVIYGIAILTALTFVVNAIPLLGIIADFVHSLI